MAEKKQKTAKTKDKSSRKSQKQNKEKNSMDATLINNEKKFKVKPHIKWTVIIFSVLALSCVFEGWRQVQKELTFLHALILMGGILATALLLWVQGFWIYIEEKYKGTLRKRVEHFEKLEEYLQRKKKGS